MCLRLLSHRMCAVRAFVLASGCCLQVVCLGSPASPLLVWALFQGSCWKDGVVGFSPAIPVKAEDAVKGDAVGIWCYRLYFVNREK